MIDKLMQSYHSSESTNPETCKFLK